MRGVSEIQGIQHRHHCLLVPTFFLLAACLAFAACSDVVSSSSEINVPLGARKEPAPKRLKPSVILNFFMHDDLLTENPSAITIVPPQVYDNTTLQGQSFFGAEIVFDDSITAEPSPDSKQLGRGRGIYVFDVNNNSTPGIQYVWTAVFNSNSSYGGSSLSFQGQDNILEPVREISITGGTGSFRLARGYAVITTYKAVAAAFILNITTYVYLDALA